MVRDPASEIALNAVGEALEDIIKAANDQALAVIADALGNVTAGTQYGEVMIGSRTAEAKINTILENARSEAIDYVERTFKEMADANDKWAEHYFEAQNIAQRKVAENEVTSSIVSNGINQAKDTIKSIVNTRAVGIVQGGQFITTRQAYIKTLQSAVSATAAGKEAFTASVQRSVRSLTDSGLRIAQRSDELPKVRYAKGRTQEVYSVARSRVMAGYRETMQAMRDQQGKEFGADGVEVTAHAMCAPDHMDYQGQQYSLERRRGYRLWSDVQFEPARPLVVGSNCHHMNNPVVLDISKPVYSDEKLAEFKRNSEEIVTFNGLSGKQLSMSRYDATQYQRGLENKVRQYSTQANLEKIAGVSNTASKKAARDTRAFYRNFCDKLNLKKRPDRMRSSV